MPDPQTHQTLAQVLRRVLSEDLPNYEIRALLNDWVNEVEVERDRILELARAVNRGQPILSYVESANEMSALVVRVL